MKRIGLIGGVGWRSTADYYRILNEEVARRRGGLHSAPLLIVSLDFAEVRESVDAGDEAAVLAMYVDALRALERAGAELIGICSNAAHRRFEQLQSQTRLRLLHIADGVAQDSATRGLRRLALLGTRETMQQSFMIEALGQRTGAEIILPDATDQDWLHQTIFGVLEQGREEERHRQQMLRIVDDMGRRGADAAVLACTELPILLHGTSPSLPLLDTTRLHAMALLDAACEESLR
jgi:aspartate racemase